MNARPVWTWLRTLLLGVLALLLWLPALPAEAQTATAGFDHLRTGFALTGRHATTSCESCHQGGVLQGTPRDCASCHRSGQRFARGNVVMSSNHLPTQLSCESCHDAKTFAGAKFNHAGVTAGSCASCHNGSSASGKSTSHVTTRASCDACHRTGATWSQLSAFDHAAVLPAACSSCHNGTRARASGKPSNHIQTTATPAMAAADCDTCHKGSYTSWANGRLHASVSVTTGCASCHSGTQLGAGGKPSTPVHANVTGNCESCHKSASTWTGAKVDHATFNDTTACGSCHNGTQGVTGRSATHMPSGSTSCAVCHGTSAWTPSKWNHTQMAVAAQCASCHTGGYPPADGRPANHIPYATIAATASANCDTCHKGSTTTWANGRLHANASIATGCAACHTGSYLAAVGKPSNALHATVGSDCESCHKSTSAWAGAKVDHSGYNDSTTCANCHNGSTATGKGSTHIPSGSTNCLTCHNTAAWAPSKWTHAQLAVTGQCASCHSGGHPPADGRPANHIPYASVAATASASCDACHKGSYSSWANGRLHSNFSVSTGCVTCHNATFLNAVGKPSNPVHATVTGNCESCHKSTATWSGAKVDHSTFNDGTACATCHNGTGATGKPATHIPAGTLNCTGCHTTAAWAPSKWNHTQLPVAAQCASCHTGGYPPADGRASNHIPYTSVPAAASANCDTCHKGSYATWATGKLHANVSVSSGCATCHTGGFVNAVGKPGNAVHATVTGNCESCHKSTATWSGAKVDHAPFNDGTVCSSCHNGSSAGGKPPSHIPAGSLNCTSCHTTASWVPSKWNHTQMSVASQCTSCHTGGYPPADGRGANHIPYASIPVAAAANCDACHKGSYASWANGRFHPNFGVSAGCATCHTGTFLNAVGKPGNAVHATVTGNCESCHKSTSTWAGAKVDHSGFNDSTVCSTCHNGSTASGKSATHIPSGSINCTSCHTTVSWSPSKWNHTQLPVAAQCASCHTGGYPPADGRVANHIPYASVPAAATANCDACHKSSYSTWSNGKFHANFSVSAGCTTCHTGAYLNAVGKPSTPIHATVTGGCESCHRSTTTWAGAKVDHTTFNDSTVCASCHNGSSATGKSATHIPSGSANCYGCHSVTTWAPSKWTHTQLPVVGQCASCHTGGYPPADGRVANHIPYGSVPVAAGANCDGCHKGSYSSWANGRFHTNYSVSTGCATCHTGAFLNAVGKPSNAVHATVTGNCESCHKSTATWSGAKVDHSTFNDSTVCSSCHNGSAATGKPGSHIPSGSTNCYACHSVTTWAPSKWNHTQLPVAAQCASCHTGGYPPADGKASNHIPYASVPVAAGANCDACHKGSYASWATGRFHANYSVSAGCYTCHTGSYLNAVGKPSNAVHATVTGTCESCHKSTATWSGAKVDHSTFNDSTVCSSCHNGTAAPGKSATHIPSGSTNCYTCHSV
ncbi:MAG: hypothetical protein JNN18_00880, partial [Rubrivivax sp.]|nr:hypothetical protein [Rubrivivax sp.]